MASLNKIFLMGNLTRDPQLSYLPSQTPVVDFGLAVNRNGRTRTVSKKKVCVSWIAGRSASRRKPSTST